MANTYKLIASNTVGSGGSSSIDFTSIPATYTDLLLKVSARRSDSTEGYLSLRFNANSGSNYSNKTLRGTGSAASSSSDSSATYLDFWVIPGTSYTATTFGNIDIYIPNYAGSTNKSVSAENVAEGNNATMYMQITAGLWAQTSAINQITLYAAGASGTFAQYSTAYLYGISNS